MAKSGLLFGISVGAIIIYRENSQEWVHAICLIALGIVYAHGLELQHEAIHGNLFGLRYLDRIFGFLMGAPMLVPFAHYRAYHLHHHRCVGTSSDAELFDYNTRSLTNPLSLIVRMWNLIKIPAFLVTFLSALQGDTIAIVKSTERRALLLECTLLFALLALAIVTAVLHDTWLLTLWIVPWLLIAEPLHFMVEVPEHIGCDRTDPSILRNTRSYVTNPIWGYFTNFNNYHIEHHLFPTLPAHRLGHLHAAVRNARGHCATGYRGALREVYAAVRSDHATS